MKKIKFKDLLFSKFFAYMFFQIIFLSLCYINKLPESLELSIEYLSVALSLTMIFLYIINFKFSKFTVIFSIFCIFLLLSTIIGEQASVYDFFRIYYRLIAITYYIDWGLKLKANNILISLYNSLYIIILINFLTIIIYPNGLYAAEYTNNWFLLYDNTHIFWYMPALLLAYINLKIKNKKITLDFIILLTMITYSVYYCFSANSVVAYTILLIFLAFKKHTHKITFLNAKTYFIAFFVLFLLIVIFRAQEIFSWLIVDILHKDLTFTNRTIIWDRIIVLIKENWIIGYGLENANIIAHKLGNSHFAHAHNTLLNVLYKGGIFTLTSFIMLMKESIKKLQKYNHYTISKIASFIVFCILIMTIFEAREEIIGFYIIFVLTYNIEYIVNTYYENNSIKGE